MPDFILFRYVNNKGNSSPLVCIKSLYKCAEINLIWEFILESTVRIAFPVIAFPVYDWLVCLELLGLCYVKLIFNIIRVDHTMVG